MACKVRLNVACSSRGKRFLVIAYEYWLLEDVKRCVEIVFQKLYPDEQTLKVSKLQNEFHFDLPPHYTVGDALTDAGLLFAIEDEQRPMERNSTTSSQSNQHNQMDKKILKRKKKSKSEKKINKRKRKGNSASTVLEGQVVSSDNRVTSTTDPSMNILSEDCKLMPQVIVKVQCEDGEVDIETVEDEDV